MIISTSKSTSSPFCMGNTISFTSHLFLEEIVWDCFHILTMSNGAVMNPKAHASLEKENDSPTETSSAIYEKQITNTKTKSMKQRKASSTSGVERTDQTCKKLRVQSNIYVKVYLK